MLFPTVEFAIFLPIVLTISWALMARPSLWKPFIVFASYVFYGAADPKFCLLLGAITVGNQIAARMIAASADPGRRQWILRVAVALDLLTLGIFKYYAFFVEDVGDLLDTIGLGMPLPLLTVLLPIGISFYTFQAITYVVDVKRGDAEPASLIDAAVYLSFFPHLVAGPIVRASEFLPQLKAPRDPSRVAVGAGIALIALGLVKKVALADTIARELVDPVFAVPQAYGTPDLLLAAYGWVAQVYCDFSGYTDIAIGVALLLGFVFPQNFNSPLRCQSFREFWRRWHMTLSRFVRDYVYIPLGGSRRGTFRTYFNLMFTMTLLGLWHGAAWTLVLWGSYNGVMMSIEHAADGRLGRRVPGWLRWFVAINLITAGLVLFRSQNLELFGVFVEQLFTGGAATLWTWPIVLAVAVVYVFQLLPHRPLERIQVWIEQRNPLVLAFGLAAVILFVGATVPSQGVPPFIYFQF
jgi:D-alanyl-lipoteichoic acid acyltransferase DltB (MBOAT superfamily)